MSWETEGIQGASDVLHRIVTHRMYYIPSVNLPSVTGDVCGRPGAAPVCPGQVGSRLRHNKCLISRDVSFEGFLWRPAYVIVAGRDCPTYEAPSYGRGAVKSCDNKITHGQDLLERGSEIIIHYGVILSYSVKERNLEDIMETEEAVLMNSRLDYSLWHL